MLQKTIKCYTRQLNGQAKQSTLTILNIVKFTVYKLQPQNHEIYSLEFIFSLSDRDFSQLTTDSSEILKNISHANETGVGIDCKLEYCVPMARV